MADSDGLCRGFGILWKISDTYIPEDMAEVLSVI